MASQAPLQLDTGHGPLKQYVPILGLQRARRQHLGSLSSSPDGVNPSGANTMEATARDHRSKCGGQRADGHCPGDSITFPDHPPSAWLQAFTECAVVICLPSPLPPSPLVPGASTASSHLPGCGGGAGGCGRGLNERPQLGHPQRWSPSSIHIHSTWHTHNQMYPHRGTHTGVSIHLQCTRTHMHPREQARTCTHMQTLSYEHTCVHTRLNHVGGEGWAGSALEGRGCQGTWSWPIQGRPEALGTL